MATKIIINRKSEWINRARGFRLFIDGKEMGKLSNGSSEEYQVEPGKHILYCKIDWCSSREINTDVKDGQTLFLKARSGMKYYSLGYVFLILSLILGPLLKLLNLPRPAHLSTIQLLILLPFLLYMTYYLTLGRKKYISLEEDKDNFFN